MNSEPIKKTICFDFDGTICDTDETQPVPGRYYTSTPKARIVDIVKRFYNKGYTVVIDTARGSSATGLTKYYKRWKLKKLTQTQLKRWGVPYHKLRVGTKIAADLYIDDKSLPVSIFEKGN